MNVTHPLAARWRGRAAGLAVAALILVGSAGGVMAASPAPTTQPVPATATTSTVPSTGGSVATRHHDRACAAQRQAAKDDPSVDTLKALGDCEIARRFVTLTRLTTVVNDAKHLTPDHRGTLLAMIDRTRDGLTNLQATIDGDDTVAALRTDLPKIAHDYRVYLLVVPQVHLTRAADAGAAAVDRLGTLADKLQARIDREQAAGKDVRAAQAALADMQRNTNLAQAQVGPVAGHVLPLLPDDWNDGSARPILDAARDSLKAARNELQAARHDAQACRADLR